MDEAAKASWTSDTPGLLHGIKKWVFGENREGLVAAGGGGGGDGDGWWVADRGQHVLKCVLPFLAMPDRVQRSRKTLSRRAGDRVSGLSRQRSGGRRWSCQSGAENSLEGPPAWRRRSEIILDRTVVVRAADIPESGAFRHHSAFVPVHLHDGIAPVSTWAQPGFLGLNQ